ncbi:MAG: hypothetical protein Q7T16_06120 [Candidatus Burarchaeum sp.]|nr:hypothetical protein [Candidatus Burarchaeum sp.]MDO8340204.1 hypothetical protein [Candidatus Burarchaeum sp.]
MAEQPGASEYSASKYVVRLRDDLASFENAKQTKGDLISLGQSIKSHLYHIAATNCVLTKDDAASMLDMLASASDESIRKHMAEVLSAKEACKNFDSALLRPRDAEKPAEVPAEFVINAVVQVPEPRMRKMLVDILKDSSGTVSEKTVVELVARAVELIPTKFTGVQLVNAFKDDPIGAQLRKELNRRFDTMDDGRDSGISQNPKKRVGEVLSYLLSEIYRKMPEGSEKDRLEGRIREVKCELQNLLTVDTKRASEKPGLASKWAKVCPEAPERGADQRPPGPGRKIGR